MVCHSASVCGSGLRARRCLDVVAAEDRATLADATRVEGDEVEALFDLRRYDESDELQVFDGGAAGPAWVDEQRADAGVRVAAGRRRQREREIAEARGRVVEGTVKSAHCVEIVAGCPFDRRRRRKVREGPRRGADDRGRDRRLNRRRYVLAKEAVGVGAAGVGAGPLPLQAMASARRRARKGRRAWRFNRLPRLRRGEGRGRSARRRGWRRRWGRRAPGGPRVERS